LSVLLAIATDFEFSRTPSEDIFSRPSMTCGRRGEGSNFVLCEYDSLVLIVPSFSILVDDETDSSVFPDALLEDNSSSDKLSSQTASVSFTKVMKLSVGLIVEVSLLTEDEATRDKEEEWVTFPAFDINGGSGGSFLLSTKLPNVYCAPTTFPDPEALPDCLILPGRTDGCLFQNEEIVLGRLDVLDSWTGGTCSDIRNGI